jgi:hypothetical protein
MRWPRFVVLPPDACGIVCVSSGKVFGGEGPPFAVRLVDSTLEFWRVVSSCAEFPGAFFGFGVTPHLNLRTRFSGMSTFAYHSHKSFFRLGLG